MNDETPKNRLSVVYREPRALVIAAVVLVLLGTWSIHHVIAVDGYVSTGRAALSVIWALLFLMLAWQLACSYFERPRTVTDEQWDELENLSIAVIMPVYNEDPAIVRQSIESMLAQTRPLQAISVCDDGSDLVDYTELEQWFHQACRDADVSGYWTRTVNRGKRHAQMAAREHVDWCHIYALVDSDSVLDPYATEEAVKPFADPEIMSVAAMVGAANVRQNLFTRVMDLWYVALQFTDRSMLSQFKSVLVNYGALAYYRAEVVDDNVDAYLNETFNRQEMRISDDSLLTLYALLKGKTVQQVTAWAFTYMPTTFQHHKNQQIRWMRGSFIRSIWRFRYLPMNRFAFWGHLLKWCQYALATAGLIGVLATQDLSNHKTVGLLLLIQGGIYYGVMLRYLTIRRSTESTAYQMGTWLLTPLAAIWAGTVLRVWRIYAMFTCVNMRWGTRGKVEVTAEA
ncbi:glycosyltransferase [Actinoplanes sp. NBRC 101535]|uniref:glycosyltransferase n=1 Tax=Actinoplanes sp. NBRC 101535 TaxID=3032196 RepID=UPI0024A09EE3|nr:glycosyltransferase [Actinoplanes sp. NBRC 101535]GLY00763.1 hyaluronan synthase [Actinoplanes sp. NBRC 101535]